MSASPLVIAMTGAQRPVLRSSSSGYRAPCTVISDVARSISRRSSDVSSTATAPMFSSRRFRFVVPGIGTIHGFFARKPWIVPIPGTTKRNRLEENIGAVAVELTSEDLREIERATSEITVQGARYPEELERRTGR